MRASLLLLLLLCCLTKSQECPAATSNTIWSNIVGNLDQMFWTPFLQRYSVVQYATEARNLLPQTQSIMPDKVPRSCKQIGVHHFLDVICIQVAGRFGWMHPCLLWARPELATSMATLIECPRRAWASEEEIAKSLNRTLQTRQHCSYATRALQCSMLQFHWVIPQMMASLLVALLSAIVVGSTVCVCGFCFVIKHEED
jgi:hypothetical protein